MPSGDPGRRARSYAEDVLSRVEALRERFDVVQYGQLDYAPDAYPLFALKNRDWRDDSPCVLGMGGVHGYETSGVHGALLFAERHAADYADSVNVMVAPCVSPWGYERMHRWNPLALDPNRSFRADSPRATPEQYNEARVAAVCAAIEFAPTHRSRLLLTRTRRPKAGENIHACCAWPEGRATKWRVILVVRYEKSGNTTIPKNRLVRVGCSRSVAGRLRAGLRRWISRHFSRRRKIKIIKYIKKLYVIRAFTWDDSLSCVSSLIGAV